MSANHTFTFHLTRTINCGNIPLRSNIFWSPNYLPKKAHDHIHSVNFTPELIRWFLGVRSSFQFVNACVSVVARGKSCASTSHARGLCFQCGLPLDLILIWIQLKVPLKFKWPLDPHDVVLGCIDIYTSVKSNPLCVVGCLLSGGYQI